MDKEKEEYPKQCSECEADLRTLKEWWDASGNWRKYGLQCSNECAGRAFDRRVERGCAYV